ncbi:sulfite oxidase [Streptosporangium sp. NBC_01755]|uniref:sulfite oxidase n=1 Tax=Streptosporangium sp. NBC_01755 TaxID=2975949 RepID=UPI002DDC03E4|nr:sulfite oxidase [Streptosporangium sp. NBC_01755]WSD00684.1 sulfite oxidase [Streptosporangium sp. NBC_01755]
MPYEDLNDEATYQRARAGQILRETPDRLRSASVGCRTADGRAIDDRTRDSEAADDVDDRTVDDRTRGGEAVGGEPSASGIVKPLPPELFIEHETNAEMRWDAMGDIGFHVPNNRFFVRNHTSTPIIDAATWRLRLHGTGLNGPRSFGYEELLALPSVTRDVAIECAGNGRSLFTAQQHQEVAGTPWRLGGIGVARWRGVPLATVLERSGIIPDAVDVMARGLDPAYVADGVDYGRVRRPIPVAKAMRDVILAYEMNDEPLPPDHGHPVRLIVPGWIGLASVKWVGDIEVSTSPLFSPWNTEFYRMFGDAYPPQGSAPLTTRGVRSAFELPWNATLVAGRPYLLRGRSWSGNGRIADVEVSLDGGATWQRAPLRGPHVASTWTRWQVTWKPTETGRHLLLARATDETGAVQPPRTTHNDFGYLFDAVVRHPVTVVSR